MAGESAEPIRRKGRTHRIAVFMATFVISLVIGKIFETVASCDTMLAVNQWQQRWYSSVNAMAPLSLAGGYLRDVVYFADTGSFSMRPDAAGTHLVAQPLTGCGVLCPKAEKKAEAVPLMALPAPAALAQASSSIVTTHDVLCGSLQGKIVYCEPNTLGYTACTEANRAWKEQFDAQCAGWVSPTLPVDRTQKDPQIFPTGERHNWHLVQFLAAPFVGLVMTFARLVEPGGSAWVWAILQLGVGFLLWLLVQALLFEKQTRYSNWPEGFWGWAVGVPFGTVICASALAFAMKYLMLGGLVAFGWFTCFAATACVASGVAGACWWLTLKLTEHAVQEGVPV